MLAYTSGQDNWPHRNWLPLVFLGQATHKAAGLARADENEPDFPPASSGFADRLSLKFINVQEAAIFTLPHYLSRCENVNVPAVLAGGFKFLFWIEVTDLEMSFPVHRKSSHVGMRV